MAVRALLARRTSPYHLYRACKNVGVNRTATLYGARPIALVSGVVACGAAAFAEPCARSDAVEADAPAQWVFDSVAADQVLRGAADREAAPGHGGAARGDQGESGSGSVEKVDEELRFDERELQEACLQVRELELTQCAARISARVARMRAALISWYEEQDAADLQRASEAAEAIKLATADAAQLAAAQTESIQAGAGEAHWQRRQATADICELRQRYEVLCATKLLIAEISDTRAQRLRQLDEIEQCLRQSATSADVDQSFAESATSILVLSELVFALSQKAQSGDPFISEVQALQTAIGSLFSASSGMLQGQHTDDYANVNALLLEALRSLDMSVVTDSDTPQPGPQTGVATSADLARGFGSVIAKVQKAAYLPAEGQPSMAEHLVATVASATALQPSAPATGDSPYAQLVRCQDLIDIGDLAGVLVEMRYFGGPQAAAAREWKSHAFARVQTDQALDCLLGCISLLLQAVVTRDL